MSEIIKDTGKVRQISYKLSAGLTQNTHCYCVCTLKIKYQAIKNLKTKSKLLKMCDTLKEAHKVLKAEGANFHDYSYMGGFPIYKSNTNHYSIQDVVILDIGHIVCSIDDKELKAFNFQQ